ESYGGSPFSLLRVCVGKQLLVAELHEEAFISPLFDRGFLGCIPGGVLRAPLANLVLTSTRFLPHTIDRCRCLSCISRTAASRVHLRDAGGQQHKDGRSGRERPPDP